MMQRWGQDRGVGFAIFNGFTIEDSARRARVWSGWGVGAVLGLWWRVQALNTTRPKN